MSLIKTLLDIIYITKKKQKTKNKEKKKPTWRKEGMDNPEAFKLEAFIENEEILIKVKRKDES